MYQVFNMGCRLEIFTTEAAAADLITIGKQFGIEAQITGRVEASAKKELLLKLGSEEIVY
jgi:phosphoribosylformylglycinamidine cyclo-ligase